MSTNRDLYNIRRCRKMIALPPGWRGLIATIEVPSGVYALDEHEYPIAALALYDEWRCSLFGCLGARCRLAEEHEDCYEAHRYVWAKGSHYVGDGFEASEGVDIYSDFLLILGPGETFGQRERDMIEARLADMNQRTKGRP